MQLQLITPEKIFFEGDIVQVNIPGTEGEFGVLVGHAPFVSTLKRGVVLVDGADGKQRVILVSGGVAEVNQTQVVVLAEHAEDCTSLSTAEIAEKINLA